MIVTEMIKSLILKNPNYVYKKSQLRLHERGSGTTIGCISILEDDKWRKIAKMINEAKNIGVMTKSLSRNPFKRGEPEENTKLAILIVENGED